MRKMSPQAHELALEQPDGAFDVFNVSAPPPFEREDCARCSTMPRPSSASASPGQRPSSSAGPGCCHDPSTAFMLWRRPRRARLPSAHDFPSLSRGGRPGPPPRRNDDVERRIHEPIEELSEKTRDMHPPSSREEERKRSTGTTSAPTLARPGAARDRAQPRRGEEHAGMVLEWIPVTTDVLSRK